jgi:hypothetical protein
MGEVDVARSCCRSTRARDVGDAAAPLIRVHAAIETNAMVEVVLAWSSCRSTNDGVAVAPLISVHAAIETIAMVEVVLA